MTPHYHYLHLHGFASSAKSRKGLFLAELFQQRGIQLHLPDLNEPSFEKLTYGGALGVIDALDESLGKTGLLRISGSSMGGYLAARWAELHSERVDSLVLLCPGFNMQVRWPGLVGKVAMEQWQRKGFLALDNGMGQLKPVHYAFIEEGVQHPAWPEVPCSTLILHGTQDQIVPFATSREYAAKRGDMVRLLALEDDHSLAGSLDKIAVQCLRFYNLP